MGMRLKGKDPYGPHASWGAPSPMAHEPIVPYLHILEGVLSIK